MSMARNWQKETIKGVAWVTLSVPLENLAGRQRKVMEERAEKDDEETSGRKWQRETEQIWYVGRSLNKKG